MPQAQARLHGEDELGQEVSRTLGDDRRAENAIAPLRGQHLREAVLLALDDGAIHLLEALAPDVVADAPLARLRLGQADTRDLGVRIGAPGDDGVVELRGQGGQQDVARHDPGHARGRRG